MTSQRRASTRIVAVKCLLSLFLVFHLSAVVILPNGTSLLGRHLGWLILDYGNLFTFNRTWQFFSPGPMPNFFLEYDVETETNTTDVLRPSLQWPLHNQNGLFDDWFVRSVAGMRFLAMDDTNFSSYFIPYLCRQNPGAIALDVRSVVEQVPGIERADEILEFKDMQERTNLPRRRYECPGAQSVKSEETK